MNDLIQRVTNAIFRQEGMGPAYPNPGNLRGCPWLVGTKFSKDAIVRDGFWRPASRAEGVAGAAHVVALRIAEGVTLTELISAWAPASDRNNTLDYIANVKKWASVPDENTPLWRYLE